VTPLPPPLGSGELVAWRLDKEIHARTWESGEGAYRAGGRWNRKGVRAVYCAIDPATAILEVAVHKGFRALDIVPHVLTSIVLDPARAFVVLPDQVPNTNWLRPSIPSAGQQEFGDKLLAEHAFILIPSVVSTESWNVIFVRSNTKGAYTFRSQEPFALDPRLHPPT